MISLRGPKLKIFASIMAVIAIVAGVYVTFFHSQGFLKTTATIVDVERNTGVGDEADTYTPIVEYTVDGKTYTSMLDEAGSKYKIGQTINVLYDPNDPSVVHGASGMGYVLMIVGAVLLAFIVFSTVKENQNQNKAKEIRESRD